MDDISDEELERRMREKLFAKDRSRWPTVETRRKTGPKYDLTRSTDGRWTVIYVEYGRRTTLKSFPSQTAAYEFIQRLERECP